MNAESKTPASKEKINNALIASIESGEFPDISVATLVSRAGVSKTTFYRHYRDIYDVVEQMIGAFLERVTSVIDLMLLKNAARELLTVLFADQKVSFDSLPFERSDTVLIDYALKSNDGTVIDILMKNIFELFVQIATKHGLESERAEVYGRFLTGALVDGYIRSYVKDPLFDFYDFCLAVDFCYGNIEGLGEPIG